MESVGSSEEEVKFNTPVCVTHITPSSSSSPTYLPQVSNPAAEISLVSENGGIETKIYGET